MKNLLAMLALVSLLFSCAGKSRWNNEEFNIHIMPAETGTASHTAYVGEPFLFRIFFSGPLPLYPTCGELYVDNMTIGHSCGMINSRVLEGTHTFTYQDYILRNPPPYQREMDPTVYEDTIYGFIDAAESDDVTVRISIRVFVAEVDDTGQLVKGKRVIAIGKSRAIHLECRSCTW